jgi:polysaccharide biosynthesis/export protein
MRPGFAYFAALLLVLPAADAASQDAVPQRLAPEQVRIYPGDVISLTVWREPDLTQNLTVPPNGIVAFPKIGARPVLDRSAEQVTAELMAEYGKYLVNPSIQIEILRKVQILGEVRSPGVYTLGPTVTVSDAVAIAGGVLPTGRRNIVELRRDGDVVRIQLSPRTAMADEPVRSGDQLRVPERSYMSQNAPMLVAAMSGVLSLVVSLVAR